MLVRFVAGWGDGRRLDALAPTAAGDPTFRRWFAKLERLATSPGEALRHQQMVGRVDVREVLPSIQAPTLVLRREHDPVFDVRHSRYVAEHIPGARFVELPGVDTSSPRATRGPRWPRSRSSSPAPAGRRSPTGSSPRCCSPTSWTRPGTRRGWATTRGSGCSPATTRRSATRSSATAVAPSSRSATAGWPRSTGRPGASAAPWPSRDRLRRLGLEVRAGLHTGECDVVGDDVGGMAVHIGARVGALAGPGEVLVSGTVRELVVGSELHFADRGEHDLRGVPGPWRLYAVA